MMSKTLAMSGESPAESEIAENPDSSAILGKLYGLAALLLLLHPLAYLLSTISESAGANLFYELFFIDSDYSLFVILASFLMFGLSLMLYHYSWKREYRVGVLRRRWQILSAFTLLMAIDKVRDIHELFKGFPQPMILALLLGLFLFVLALSKALFDTFSKEIRRGLALGTFIYLSGAFAWGGFNHFLAEWTQAGGWTFCLSVMAEEGLEMLGLLLLTGSLFRLGGSPDLFSQGRSDKSENSPGQWKIRTMNSEF